MAGPVAGCRVERWMRARDMAAGEGAPIGVMVTGQAFRHCSHLVGRMGANGNDMPPGGSPGLASVADFAVGIALRTTCVNRSAFAPV
jgi:hypothetical protein